MLSGLLKSKDQRKRHREIAHGKNKTNAQTSKRAGISFTDQTNKKRLTEENQKKRKKTNNSVFLQQFLPPIHLRVWTVLFHHLAKSYSSANFRLHTHAYNLRGQAFSSLKVF